MIRPGRRAVSPPTRGWTSSLEGLLEFSRGFPAHAGMDRIHDIRQRLSVGFPRPRGDGPRLRAVCWLATTVSPPTRGWTVIKGMWTFLGSGFPAHAGMDPPTRPRCPTRKRFPRPRGDGPFRPTPFCAIRRFPRPRGDGPLSVRARSSLSAVSPPTRGWTLSYDACLDCGTGFPAHAGMDPRPKP